MISIRNALAVLAKDSSVVAVGYRDIQRLNSANIDALSPIVIESTKVPMEPYTDIIATALSNYQL